MIGAAPAAAVELKTLTAQVNPKSDLDGSFFLPTLTADGSGGFAVVWGKRAEAGATSQIFARFYDRKAKPKTSPVRIDGPVDGEDASGVSLVSAAALGGDRMIATWSASFYPVRPADGVGRLFDDGEPAKKIVRVEDEVQMSLAMTTELNDGRAIVGWSTSDTFTRLVGRFVKPDGKLGKPNLAFTVDGSSSRPVLRPLHEDILAVAFRTTVGGGTEVAAQLYDTDGKRRGDTFVLVEATPRLTFTELPIGLPNGQFVLLDCVTPTVASVCNLTAQRFKRNGRKEGLPKVLLRGLESQSTQAVSLDGGGFLVAFEETDQDSRTRIIYRRYDNSLKQVGSSASLKSRVGQRRGPMKRLANGRVAALITVNSGDLFVQTITP